jgi:cytochrome P450
MAAIVRPPGPKPKGVIGNLPMADPNALARFTEWAHQYGDIFHYRVFHRHVYFINHPDLIKEVLITQAPNFIKGDAVRANRRIFGNGLLANEGASWLRQRRLIQPAFHRSHIEAYAGIMVRYTERMLAGWHDGDARDIHQDMMRLTLEIVSMALFSVEIAPEKDRVALALDDLMELSIGLRVLLPAPFRRFPTRKNRRYEAANRQLDEVVYSLIRERQANPGFASRHGFEDLLGLLLQARYEDGAPMPDEQLRDEVMTLLLAGHETTAVSLSWLWMLLSEYPEAEQTLHAELDTVLQGRSPTMQDLARLPYTDCVVKEALRLYPPAWATVRTATKDCEIAGYRVPAGCPVLMSQWIMHRDARYYDQPNSFLPERWLGERCRTAPRFAYFPFGGGPRMCIGASFAQTEAALVLATIAQQYRMRVTATQPIEPVPSITLRPRHGVPVSLMRRADAPRR